MIYLTQKNEELEKISACRYAWNIKSQFD